jgi:hypothetical protein
MVGAMKGMKVLGCAGAFALLAASGASAQEGEAVKSLLGSIGIIPKEKAPIVYNERAPLVLPPKMDLPAPSASADARDTNWPKDPDVAARRKAAAEARTPYRQSEYYKNSEARRLGIDEIRADRDPNNYATAPNMSRGRTDKSVLKPEELAKTHKSNDDVQLSGDGLERRYLSDPPQGLLRAAGNAPVRATADPRRLGDPDSPTAWVRQQSEN